MILLNTGIDQSQGDAIMVEQRAAKYARLVSVGAGYHTVIP